MHARSYWANHWNQTQHSLHSIWRVKTEDTITDTPINYLLSYHINRQQNWRRWNNVIKWIIEIKRNTHNTRFEEWKQKKEDTQKISINKSLFSFLFAFTENYAGDKGATSLSELLKSNTTLTALNLSSKYKEGA